MTVTLDVDEYHALRSRERDHLMAAAIHAAQHDTIPSTRGLTETVGRLTGSMPSYETTQAALDGLADAGLVERRDGEPTTQARGVAVTATGRRVLAYGAARLDAAATAD
jgi:predicted transcriptional regulator